MMTNDEFESYKRRLALPQGGLSYLEVARNGMDGKPAAPSRRVESTGESLVIRYPSSKNEKVLPLESRRVEFAIALLLENDDDVLEFLTQPPKIEISYRRGNGKKEPSMITPDFIVLRRGGIELVEGKTVESMIRLVKDEPRRYKVVGKNRWKSPPAETAARTLGFKFRLWTDAEFSRERIRNLKHLDCFLKLGPKHFDQYEWKPVEEFVLAQPGITLDELSLASGVKGAALVRWMLAHRLIYCDLDKFVLADPENARIYPTCKVSKSMEAARIPVPRWPSVRNGAEVLQKSKSLSDFTRALLERGADAFDQAYSRWLIIMGRVPRHKWDVTERSVSNWRCAYKTKGYIGLLSNRHKQGNRIPRVCKKVRKMAMDVITRRHSKPPKKKVFQSFLIFKAKCKEAGVEVPSHVWFYDQFQVFSKVKLTEDQEGKRAAYPFKFNPKSQEGLWDSRGDYPFMDVHCDHTELSIFLRSRRTGQKLRKPWLTVLFDATCRMVLALYLSFDSPARDTLMMILRDCVERWGRLPFGLVVDHGPEFESTYFETFTGANGIMVTKRPKARPKYGNPVENFFGVTESQFIQELQGSSLILKTPRVSTKAVDPRDLSTWNIRALFDAVEHHCFKLLNNTEHNDLGMTPAKAFDALLTLHGIKYLPTITFDNEFLIQTMPEVDDKTARVQKPCGVKVRGDYFSNVLLSGYLGSNLPVRWDPMDPSRVLVQTREGWIECKSKYEKEVQGLSCRDVKFFAQELRARHAATRRNRENIYTARGKFLMEITETKEPELKKRIATAKENYALNGKRSEARPATPRQKIAPSTSRRRVSAGRKPGPSVRIKAPRFV